jgi:hypothetical protein
MRRTSSCAYQSEGVGGFAAPLQWKVRTSHLHVHRSCFVTSDIVTDNSHGNLQQVMTGTVLILADTSQIIYRHITYGVHCIRTNHTEQASIAVILGSSSVRVLARTSPILIESFRVCSHYFLANSGAVTRLTFPKPFKFDSHFSIRCRKI